jgi:hypothetical protein
MSPELYPIAWKACKGIQIYFLSLTENYQVEMNLVSI